MGVLFSVALWKSVIFDPNCIPFTVAFVLLMLAFVFEIMGLILMGTGILTLLDNLIPDSLNDHDFGLDWAKHKNVPIAIWASIILAVFAIVGFTIQTLSVIHLGHTFNIFVVSIVSIIPAILIAKHSSYVLAESVFVDSTVAVTVNELIGCNASIVIGVSTKDTPAECKIVDKHGKPHYMMAVPFNRADTYTTYDSLVVMDVSGNRVLVAKKVDDRI